jgi:poly-gamma-glutamate capsule biosynthesis protein CapA/YwtB (metallophosphatase superfamily)
MDNASDLVKLVAVGDICLGMEVRDSIRQFGTDFPFAQCSQILQNADLVFGNLEMVLHEKGTILTPLKENRFDFNAPLHYGDGLKRAGFRILSAANNHILDFGPAACRDTLNFLKGQGIQAVGCGEDLQEARKPAILTVRGKRIGFLAYTDDDGQSLRPNPWHRRQHRRHRHLTGDDVQQAGCLRYHPCVAPIKKKYLLEDILALRPQVDLIVVSLHADLEFSAYPAPWRVRLCRQLIDAGADLVFQHHPHVPQGVERYGKGMIIYSLGSFIFPIYGNSYANQPHTDQSFILAVRMSAGKVGGAEVWPVRINRFHQPVPLGGEDRNKFLQYLHTISLPLQSPEFLNRFWAINCRRAFGIHWSWLKEAYWDMGWPEVLHRLRSLARKSENRRWLLGLVAGLVRFGFNKKKLSVITYQ